MNPQLQWIGVITDDINESVNPHAKTTLEAVFKTVPESVFGNFADVEAWITACKALLITRKVAPGEHVIGLGAEHPANADRLAISNTVMVLKPLYQDDFKVTVDPNSLFRFEVELSYRSAEEIDNNHKLRKPPDRLHWEDRFNSYSDPNNGKPHLNTAGDWIKDIEETRTWLAFHYKWTSESPPAWLHEYGNSIVNTDTVILDGESFPPETLCTSRPECRAVRSNKTGWSRENELWVLHNPFGWRRKFPNIGFRERKLHAPALGIGTNIVTQQNQYESIQQSFRNRTQITGYYTQTKQPIRSLQKIATRYNGDEYLTDPAPLDKYGMAFRDWAQTNGQPDWPLLDPVEPNNLIILEFRTKLFLPFAPMGLW